MKTTLKLFGLIAIVFLSSCSNNTLIVKRKYNSGYYVSSGKLKATKESDIIKEKSEREDQAVNDTENEASVSAGVDNEITLIAEENNFVSDEKKKTELSSSEKEIQKVEAVKKEKALLKIEKKINKAEKRATKKQNKKSGGDAEIIVLVILSLIPILALIAMYIKDGHNITLNFWVDLLLHLTIIGYIVFALLVVFDIVDLS